MQKYSIFVGIDLSKKWFDVALCVGGNLNKMPHAQFGNHGQGYHKLLNWLTKQLGPKQLQQQCLFCMEHTGVYSLALCQFLDQRHCFYVLDNPLRIRRSLGLRRGKSDKADARAIAEYAWRYQDELHKRRALPNELLLKMQTLLRLRDRLVKYRQGLQVASMELESCVDARISRLAIQQSALVVHSINQGDRAIRQQIRSLIQSDARLCQLYDLLISVIGIGPIIASFLLVYTNGFTAFENARQFACHIGVAPFKQQSGTSLNLPDQVCAIANPRLKVLLSNAAIVAVKCDPQLRAFFERQLKRGKEKGWIYNAIKNKIVHRIFAVVNRGTPFVKFEF